MAKALIGHLGRDPRPDALLGVENARLRGRVEDLESLVRRLSEENDHLTADLALARAARLGEAPYDDPELRERFASMQPA